MHVGEQRHIPGFGYVVTFDEEGGLMSYLVGIQIRAEDVSTFASEFDSWVKGLFLDLGAGEARLAHTIYGGDRAGLLFASATFDSIMDAALAEKGMNSDHRVGETMAKAGAQRVGRSLGVIRAQRGELTGEYGTTLLIESPSQQTEAEVQQGMDDSWVHMQGNGVTGLRQIQLIAAGENTGLWAAGTYTDDLDGLMANSAAMFSDTAVQQAMSRLGNRVLGRSIFRVLSST